MFPTFGIIVAWAFLSGSLLSARDALAASRSPIAEIAFSPGAVMEPALVLQDTTLRGTGAQTRRARALLRKRQTTLGTEQPVSTQSILDSIRALPRDSSARLEQFHHVRVDHPMVTPFRSSTHPLYVPEPVLVRTQHQLDTASYQYRVRKVVGGADIKEPLTYSFDEYKEERFRQAIRQNWETMARKYELATDKKRGLGDLFGSVTNIEIPVPKNPLFSIFGPNIIRLQINGAVDIHAAFRNTSSDLFVNNPLGQSRNEPDFNQNVQVNVKGEIGDKLKIDADWNTQRTFEFENQLRVRYTGYEDDVVQSVEAGNVSLQTNSSFISGNQALFGIKAAMQFGPLKLTTIASQKKGQIRELTVSGGGRPTPFTKRATDYSRDHYFIDTSYVAWFDSVYLNIPARVDLRKEIRDIEVWVTRIGNEDPNERDVVAFLDESKVRNLQDNPAARRDDYNNVPGEVEVGRFIKLEQGIDYTYHPYAGYITLNRSLQPEQAIAAAYSLPHPTDSRNTVNVGNFGSRQTADTLKLIMKLVRPQRLGPHLKTAWRMMLKNIYPLGGRGIKKEGFEMKIRYEVSGQEPQDNILGFINLIEMFSLDRYGEQPGSPPDGKFDYSPGVTIDESRGELIFPRTEPFREGIRRYFQGIGRTIAEADSFVFHEVYDTTFNGASNSARNKFLMQGTITSSIASTYPIGFNVVEGSVEVIANGQKANLGADYTVDYISGQVVIRNQGLLVPGTNLQIKYEANDLFQLASKSLLGARGDLSLGRNTGFGFTVMNLNQQTLSDKVRLGEEPINNTIFGIDGGTAFEMDFLTRALNYLPGVQTTTPSSFSLRGEAAYMLPDPNTRKSSISQDQGAGIAYIDDFEGARRTIPLPIAYTNWFPASVPEFMPDLDLPLKRTLQEKHEYRAKLDWYNILPSDVLITDLKPAKLNNVVRGEEQVTVLNLYLRPNLRAPYNYSMDLENKLFANPRLAWNGIMWPISSTTSNLLDENINFIEFWVYLEKSQPTVKLSIDMGIISEDAIPNNRLDTEDGLLDGVRNGILDAGEDVGIDGLNDNQERIEFAAFIAKYPQYANDPSGDNWVRPVASSLRPEDYTDINGTEGNSQSEAGRFPDTEDRNRNNVLDRSNSYFTYAIPLDTLQDDFRRYISGGGTTGWYQIRIPIIDTVRSVGTPSFSNIETIRLWISGAQQEVLVRFAEMNLVGNQWEELIKNDSTFKVSVVNKEDNPSYDLPPGLPEARDRTRPDQTIFLNEQSLNLVINNLQDGDVRQAIKRFPVRPLDLFSYRTMRMFVHGDTRPAFRTNFTDINNYDLELFFRFGSDSLNYYEYRTPVRPGWDPSNEVSIHFAEITAIKLSLDSAGARSDRIPVPNGPEGATYLVRGNPTLTNIRLLVIGVENPYNKGKSVYTGEVWVNELRLTDVDDTPGWAYRFDSQIKFADIASLSFNMTQRDPHFHGLEDRFGSRATDRNWSLAATVGFEKLLPQSWAGSSLAFSYSRVEQIQNPKYLPGTDILVDEAVTRTRDSRIQEGVSETAAADSASNIRFQTQSLTIIETYSLPNLRLNVPVQHWLVSETINRLSFAYSFNRSVRRTPTVESFNQWQWNARVAYGVQLSDQNYVEPFSPFGDFFLFSPFKGLKLFYLPRGFNFSTTLTRGQTNEQARNQTAAKPVVRNFVASRSMSFSWQFSEGGLLNLGSDYALDIQSTLLNMETNPDGQQRSFTAILGQMFGKAKLIDFGDDLTYGQTITFTPRPVIPAILKLDKFLSLGGRYSSRFDWTNNLQAGNLGRSAGVSANLNMNFDVNVKTIGNEIWSQTQAAPADTAKGLNVFDALDRISRIAIKTPIFDFDKVTFSFTQQNRSQNSGVLGRAGFANVFGRVPFFQSSLPEHGPSLMYQLGLSSDPHGDVIMKTKGSFPFFTGSVIPGLRAPGGNLSDVFSQTNRMSMRTSRPLWEGASIEINWNVGWSYTVNRSLNTDSLGIPTESNKVVSGDVERSYLTFPPILFFKFFRTSIEDVQKQFERMRIDPSDTRTTDAKLAAAFEDGLEAVPLLKSVLGNLVPRPNWSLRWEGLEKFPVFNLFAARASFDHNYTSGYKRRWKISPTGEEITENQQITYGFTPLVGLNFQLKEFIKGSFTTNFRYGVTTSYDLQPAAQNLVESDVTDITVSATYGRQGFEFPFFGLSLSNDIDISFSYSYSKNSRKVYDMKAVNFKKDGTVLDGTTRTILEPRIRYILSSRVTASVYYKYSKTDGSRIPGQTINEGGLDVRVAIQP